MYKIVNDEKIKRLSDGALIPRAPGNRDYDQFVADVSALGAGIVEGADVIESDYVALRTGPDGYPPIAEQLDVLTKEGIAVFQAVNQAVKDKYPKTVTGGISIAPLPDWVLAIDSN